MARKNKIIKAKEPVRLRYKKLSNGSSSLYLDIYKDGKRSYEFLKSYLVPETDEQSKTLNANTLRAAEAIKAQRIIELTNSAAGITNVLSRGKMLLADWMKIYADKKKRTGQSEAYSKIVSCTTDLLVTYGGEKVMMKDVDKAFCQGFADFLRTDAKNSFTGKNIATSTQNRYFSCFSGALNEAVRDEIIPSNPINKISRKDLIRNTERPRAFLSEDEVRRMAAAYFSNDMVKRAFMFSCFCGLRISDVRALKWKDIVKVDPDQYGNEYQISITMKKTQELLTLPLSKTAMLWLPERGDADGEKQVFHLPSTTAIDSLIKRVALKCRISKDISFHTSRHTFVTMLINRGVDPYTIGKLTGHKNIKMIEVYAKLLDKQKSKAVNVLDDILSPEEANNNL